MSLLWPQFLWLAVAAPLLVVAHLWLARRRGSAEAGGQAYPQIRRGVTAGGQVRFDRPPRRHYLVAWRLWAAFLLVVVALARPQWGQVAEGPPADAPGEVIIALDLSRSMLAKDVAPSRLELARALAARLAEDLPDRRVGLIGFAGSAHVLAPPSEDRAVLKAYLPRMQPEHMPLPGTSFADLLAVAAGAFSPAEQGRSLVVLSDGEAQPSAWEPALAALQARHVHVVAVGVGTEGGAQIQLGGQTLRSSANAPVISRLNPGALQALASGTGGRYLEPSASQTLAEAVRAASAPPPAAAGRRARSTQLGEQYAWFVAAALALLMWSAAVEFTARPRLHRRPEPSLARAAMTIALLAALLPPAARAAAPLLTKTDLQGEADPLEQMKALVASLVQKPRLEAADDLQIAEVAARYGEIHRGHGHGLEEGVLRDGLAAVAAGRRLQPELADWARLEAKLRRLLVPPPLVPPDPGPADPANEPTGAQGQAPIAGEDARDSSGDAAGKEPNAPTAGEQGLQNVGGTQKDEFSAAEWRNPALVQSLDQLQRLRAADSPADLFARMHAPAARPPAGGQTW